MACLVVLIVLLIKLNTVQSCRLLMDSNSGKSKGFGFIEMPTSGEAKIGIKKLNNNTMDSNNIRVKKAEDKNL